MNNSSIDFNDVARGGGLGEAAPVNTNPMSATDLGSGLSSRQPVPSAPSNIGVGGPAPTFDGKLPEWTAVNGYVQK